MSPAAIQPRGAVAAVPERFAWSRVAGTSAPARLALLDEGYFEVAAVDGIAGSELRSPASFREAMQRGGTFHWQVTLQAGGETVASRLQTFEIR